VNRAVDNSHLKLSTAFYKELGFIRVRVCHWQAPWAVDNMLFLDESEQISEFVSDPNSAFWFFFSPLEGLHAYKKRGHCLYIISCIMYHVPGWFNKLSPPFCPKDVGNCRTSLNLVFSLSSFVWFILTLGYYSLVHLYFVTGGSQQVVSKISGFDREFRSGGANQFENCLQFHSEVKI